MKNYSEYKRNQRKARVRANGGYINYGLEFLDFGMNMFMSDRMLNIGYYNAGISMRIGNFRAPVQFEIGVKPGVIFYAMSEYDDYYYDDYDYKTAFHLPIYAKLKVNLCSIGNKSKLYASSFCISFNAYSLSLSFEAGLLQPVIKRKVSTNIPIKYCFLFI